MGFAMFGATVSKTDHEIHRAVDCGQPPFPCKQGDVNVWVLLVETTKARHQPVSSEGVVGSDLKKFLLFLRSNSRNTCLDPGKALLACGQQDISCLGQQQAAMDAVEQPNV
jgi:hypothetical protein